MYIKFTYVRCALIVDSFCFHCRSTMSVDQMSSLTQENQQNLLTHKKILSSILRYSSIGDATRLARTCRPAFEAAMPFVWENLEGAQHLFRLLPRTIFIYDNSAQEIKSVVSL